MFNVLAISSLLAALFVPAALPGARQLLRADSPPTSPMSVSVSTVNGTGCPVGTTAAAAVTTDNTKVTITYGNYKAAVGVGSSVTDFRKNCEATLAFNPPAGYTLAVTAIDYQGYASLAPGASGTLRANYYFQGTSQGAYTTHSIGATGGWLFTDTIAVAAQVYPACGALPNLNINTELRVMAGTSDSTTTGSNVEMDSGAGNGQTVYHISWMKCA